MKTTRYATFLAVALICLLAGGCSNNVPPDSVSKCLDKGLTPIYQSNIMWTTFTCVDGEKYNINIK